MSLLPDQTWAEIKPIFAAAYPREAVVAVFQDGSWRHCDNTHPEPWRAFTISKSDTDYLTENEPALFLHSHPNRPGEPAQAWPSDEDTENQLATGWNWGIVAVNGNPVAGHVYDVGYPEIWGPDAPVLPLQGRQYLWGIRDCLTLVRDYYTLAGFQIEPQPRVREPGAHHTDPAKVDPFAYWPVQQGFVPMARADRQPGDLVIVSEHRAHCNHLMIYLGEGRYLEQPEKSLSGERQIHNEEKVLERLSAEFWRKNK